MDRAILMAIRLEAAGVQIKEVSDCKPRVDGCVFITDQVSVQVATDGAFASVTKIKDGVFGWSPNRAQDDIDSLVADIIKAIA